MAGMINGANGAGPKHASGTFLFTSESVGEGHPDKIWYGALSSLEHGESC